MSADLCIMKIEHECETPGYLGDEVRKARWRCPACQSFWEYTVPDGYSWKRIGGSSWRWKREARRRALASLSVTSDRPVTTGVTSGKPLRKSSTAAEAG